MRKRLALLYPETHSMDVIDSDDSFEVIVQIEDVNLIHNHGNKMSDSR